MPATYLPVLFSIGFALLFGALLLGVSQLAARQTGGRDKQTTYESGMPLLDRSHKRISIAFFLIAIDFIVFDLEAAFLYPWALIVREGGWDLFWAVMVFLFLVLVGLAYVWRKGGLDLGADRRRLGAGWAGGGA